jgi:hypothetical protein
MINPGLTFNYKFAVQDLVLPSHRWVGQGSGRSTLTKVQALAGPEPRFELGSGWLTLFPTDGFTRSFPIQAFSDQPQPREMGESTRSADFKARLDVFLEALKDSYKAAGEKVLAKENFDAYRKEQNAALRRELRERKMTRDFASFSLFVGDSLSSALRTGDDLKYSRDGGGDFRYSVERSSETVFSAGAVGMSDPGGPIAVWQEYDRQPNPYAESLGEQFPLKVAEWIEVHKPYVTARIQERQFQLLDGEEALIDPYYVFLPRSNQNVPWVAFEGTPRAVHSAGRLDLLSKDQIIDAAHKLTTHRIRLL